MIEKPFPGEILAEWMEYSGVSSAKLEERGADARDISAALKGNGRIPGTVARAAAFVLGTTESFWTDLR